MAQIATGSKTTLHYVAESTYGTTPATPAFKPVCVNNVTLGMTKDAIESACFNATRQVKDLRHGNRQVGNGFTGELHYGVYDDLMEAALMGTWATNVLKAGTTRRSFTMERFFDLDTNEYHRWTGCEVNTLAISIAPNSMVSVDFGIVGKDLDDQNLTSQVAGATYAAESTVSPFDCFTGSITIDAVSSGEVTQLDLSLENGIDPTFVLFDKTTVQPGDGKSRLTGTLTALYTSKALYEKFIQEASIALVVTLQDPDGNELEITIPNVKITGGNPDATSEGNITCAHEFTAVYDSASATQITITRTPAP